MYFKQKQYDNYIRLCSFILSDGGKFGLSDTLQTILRAPFLFLPPQNENILTPLFYYYIFNRLL